jgi:RES domain-containing protein
MASRLNGQLRAYCIADRRHKIFDGEGAALPGGRWNSPGRRVIDASETYAGATLEVLVHSKIGKVLKTHSRIERNIAINQEHPDFNRLRTTAPKPVIWDQRLFRLGRKVP